MDKLPLNATVWIPEGTGPFPLVLIVHGNHDMAEFSDPGYLYLGELLASRGFLLATIDENFLNSGLFHDPPKQQAVRGWMLLEHLKLWRDWSKDPDNPLHVAIDFNQIALMGHSRGGEAVATAALFNTLAYDPDARKLVRVSIPFWLIRMAPSQHFSFLNDNGIDFDSDRVRLNYKDLERLGPGLILDQKDRRGSHVLVWTE